MNDRDKLLRQTLQLKAETEEMLADSVFLKKVPEVRPLLAVISKLLDATFVYLDEETED